MIYTLHYASPVGSITLAESQGGLCGLWIEGQNASVGALSVERKTPLLADAVCWLDAYFGGTKPAVLLPLSPMGNHFRRLVWQLLCDIPYGTVTTYGAVARRVEAVTGRPMSAQAIGNAVGHNPISIIIPCHRVVGARGVLTGYSGGIDLKIKLLTLEGLTVNCPPDTKSSSFRVESPSLPKA